MINVEVIEIRDATRDILSRCITDNDVRYTSSHQNYQYEYFDKKNQLKQAFRVVIYENDLDIIDEIVSVRIDDGVIILDQFGYGISCPKHVSTLPKKTLTNAFSAYVEVLLKIFSQHRCSLLRFTVKSTALTLEIGEQVWLTKVAINSSNKNYKLYSMVDLSLEVGQIKRQMRKSYRSLINPEKNGLVAEVYTNDRINQDMFDAFRSHHIKVSGRETRSRSSWDAQFDMVKRKNAFLVTVSQGGSSSVLSYSLFENSDFNCLYSTGVYDRQYRQLPLGHIAIFKAIEHAKYLGLESLILGELMEVETSQHQKDYSISHFKAGFSTFISTELQYEINKKI